MDIDAMVERTVELLRERGSAEDRWRAQVYADLWASEGPEHVSAAYFAVGFLWGAREISDAPHTAALKELEGW